MAAAIDDSHLQYRCKICFKRFLHSSALGGHISKAHPGQSSAYNHKKRVRETRELERELHRHTMRVYQESLVSQGTLATPETGETLLNRAIPDAAEGASNSEPQLVDNVVNQAATATGRGAKNGQ